MGFVELTLDDNGYPIYINISRIESVERNGDGGTSVWVTGDEKYIVRESYEEVKSAINVRLQGGRK